MKKKQNKKQKKNLWRIRLDYNDGSNQINGRGFYW